MAIADELDLYELFDFFKNQLPSNLVNDTILEKRIELLPLSEIVLNRYLQDLCEYSKIDEFYKYLEYPPFKNDVECSNYFMGALNEVKNYIEMFWVVLLKSEDKAIGTVKLNNFHLKEN